MTNYVNKINNIPIGGNIFDGLPTFVDTTLSSGVELGPSETFTSNLSSTLPNDGQDYMCMFEVQSNNLTGVSSTNGYYEVTIHNSTTGDLNNNIWRLATAGRYHNHGIGRVNSVWLPIFANNKNVTLMQRSNGTDRGARINSFKLKQYYRLGSNEDSGNYIDNITTIDHNSPIGDDTVNGNNSVTLEKAATNGLNSVTVSGGLKRSLLPEGYTQYDYITVNGDCYYITDYYPSNITEIKTKTFLHKQPTSPLVTRWTAGPTNDTFGFYMGNVSGRLTIFYGRYSDGRYLNIENTKLNIEHSIYMGVNSITFDGTSYSITRDTFTSTEPIYIGAFNQTGTSLAGMMYGRIYPVEFIENGRTVKHYIPCKNNNGVIGLYEAITGTFISPTGSGTATAGSNAALPSPSNPIPIVSNNGELKVINTLYNTATAIDGYFINASGVIAEQSGLSYSPLIPVKPNTNYTFSGINNYTGMSNKRLHAYDSNGDWIEQIAYITMTREPGTTFSISGTTSANTAFVRVSYVTNDANIRLYETAHPMSLYVSGVIETITDNASNTATAEMLLSIGDYTDTQEILSGDVTRKVGVIVLNGTEDWSTDTYGGYRRFYFTNSIGQYEELTPLICSHYLGKTENRQTPNSIFLPTTGRLTIYIDSSQSIDTVANWNSWLASQYNAGTPVIIVYPLATETTETVTGQILTTTQGNNTLTITQASVADLPIEVNYDKLGDGPINIPVGGKILAAKEIPINIEPEAAFAFTGTEYKTYDLSQQIPSDGYAYELLVQAYTRSNQNAYCRVYIGWVGADGNFKTSYLQNCGTDSNGSIAGANNQRVILQPNSRVIRFGNNSGSATGSCRLQVVSYKRLGTNE